LPAIDIPETSKESIRILPNLIGSALAWASKPHSRKDPATHAIVLIRKQVIPKGKDTLLKILRETQQLSSLDVLVAVVDSIGSSPVGVSVLLASKSEKVSIKSLKGAKNDVLRVGKWHAKDTEEDESMNFEDILASIRKGKEVPSAAESTSESIGRDLVFVLGEMEGVQNQASSINKEYPLADIVSSALTILTTVGDYTFQDTDDKFIVHNLGAQRQCHPVYGCSIVPYSEIKDRRISFSDSRTQSIVGDGKTHPDNNLVIPRLSHSNNEVLGELDP
jgi:hypothetical protein